MAGVTHKFGIRNIVSAARALRNYVKVASAFILLDGADIHVALRRIWSWIGSISLRCSVRRSASIVSPGWSMRRPALIRTLGPPQQGKSIDEAITLGRT
jgi:hypothetical protein